LLPQSVDEYVEPNNLARFIIRIVEALDLQPLIEKYSNLGQNAYHPQMMLGLLFYAYSQGEMSSRRIAENIKYDLRYKYITCNLQPDFRTISDFRKDNIIALQRYFVEIVRMCKLIGLIKLNNISIDGTKISASASSKKFRDRDELTKELEQVEEQIVSLLAQAQRVDEDENDDAESNSLVDLKLAEKEAFQEKLLAAKNVLDGSPRQKRVNLTDLDCRDQGRFGPGYNCQAAVDCESQIILCAEVVSTPVDNDELLPMINQVETDTDTIGQAKNVFADSGYESGANCVELETKPHIDAYVASKRQDKQSNQPQSPFAKASFYLDPDKQQCSCPLGHAMRLRQCREVDGVIRWDFIGIDCPSCSSRDQCTKAKYRNVQFYSTDQAMQRMRDKMETDAGKAAMRIRRRTIEPVFGQLKHWLKKNTFSLRGMVKVQGEFTLMAMVHNLKKMHKYLSNGRLDCLLSKNSQVFVAFYRIFLRFVQIRFICFVKLMNLMKSEDVLLTKKYFQRAILGQTVPVCRGNT